tara:strand:+ start:2856 stop:3026 length:171 start_codon:yes stop_codon:yes gene_type:complete
MNMAQCIIKYQEKNTIFNETKETNGHAIVQHSNGRRTRENTVASTLNYQKQKDLNG